MKGKRTMTNKTAPTVREFQHEYKARRASERECAALREMLEAKQVELDRRCAHCGKHNPDPDHGANCVYLD